MIPGHFKPSTRQRAGIARCGPAMIALSCILFCGCGGELASVGGTVTLDGKPLDRGTVVFHGEERAQGVGKIEVGGSYSVRTGTQGGLAPGTYRVTVSAFDTKPAPNGQDEPIPLLVTPAKYNSPETSELQAQISAGSNQCAFDLTGN